MRAYSLSALIAACTFHVASFAQTASPGGDAELGIDQVFKSLLKEGKTSEDSALVPLSADWIYAGDAASAYPFVDRIPTGRGILLKTRLPITGQPERPQRDLTEVLKKINEACKSSGGNLVRREIPAGISGGEVPQVARGFQALAKENLMGQFWCERVKTDPVFFVVVIPNKGATVPLIPTGWDWNIALWPVTDSVLAQHVKRRSEYEQSVSSLRSSLKVGDNVQVRTPDLPDALIASWQKRFPRLIGSICGLVTEVKRPLAKVQFQTVELSVEVEKLFPQGTKIPLNEVTTTDPLQPQAWCLR
jgi:hypothetical protein